MADSRYLSALKHHQTQLNYFLYSSLLSADILRTRVLSAIPAEQMEQPAYQLFRDVTSVVFYPPDNRRFPAHYVAKTISFKEQLARNIEHVSRWVIVRFHTYLENFLEARLEAAQNGLSHFQKHRFHLMICALHSNGFLKGSFSELKLAALKAEINRELRHYIVHREPVMDPSPLLTFDDQEVRQRAKHLWQFQQQASCPICGGACSVLDELKKNKCPSCGNACVSKADVDQAVNMVCDEARNNESQHAVPRLFFYALFTFTNYRRLAQGLDEALPAK